MKSIVFKNFIFERFYSESIEKMETFKKGPNFGKTGKIRKFLAKMGEQQEWKASELYVLNS